MDFFQSFPIDLFHMFLWLERSRVPFKTYWAFIDPDFLIIFLFAAKLKVLVGCIYPLGFRFRCLFCGE